jgi:ribosomal protein S6
MQTEPKLYEMTYLLKVSGSEKAEYTALEHVRKYLGDKSGMITDESPPQKRYLSYPINKQTEALSGYIKFFLKPEELEGIKELLAGEEEILRHIIVHSKRTKTPSGIRVRRVVKKPDENKNNADVETIDRKLDEILGA